MTGALDMSETFARLLDSASGSDSPLVRLFDKIEEQLTSMLKRIEAKFDSRMKEMEESVNFAVAEANEAKEKACSAEANMNKLSRDVDTLAVTVDRLAADNDRLREKIVDQEAYSRRNNLIISGMPEDRGEQSVMPKVHEMMARMGHTNPFSVPFINAHRLGPKRNGDGPRDIIIRII